PGGGAHHPGRRGRRLLHPHTSHEQRRSPMSPNTSPSHSFRLDRIDLIRIAMPLKKPFTTSFGTTTVRDVVIVRVEAGGAEGYGELVAMEEPIYNEES